jgi:hypothetical protein
MITTTTAPHTINVFSRTMSNMTGQNLKQVHHHTFSMWLLEIIDITEILLKVGLNTTIPHNYM